MGELYLYKLLKEESTVPNLFLIRFHSIKLLPRKLLPIAHLIVLSFPDYDIDLLYDFELHR